MTTGTTLALTILPESVLDTRWFSTLAAFVAINTILYVTLSIFKIMPKLYLSDYFKRQGRRTETRSIFPNGEGPPKPRRNSGELFTMPWHNHLLAEVDPLSQRPPTGTNMRRRRDDHGDGGS